VLPESLATLSIAGNPVLPINATVSADSSIITFAPPPNSDSTIVVTGVVPTGLAVCCSDSLHTGYVLQLNTTAKVTTPVILDFPSTVSTAAPALAEPVTVTSSDGDFTIDPAATVTAGGLPTAVTNVAGNSITFIPSAGAVGPVVVNGVLRAGFNLSLPSTGGDITTAPGLLGTESAATAPPIAVPDVGNSISITDGGAFAGVAFDSPARLYTITVPSDRTITLTIDWPSGEDLGAYLFAADGFNDAGDTFTGFFADDGGEGAHPEQATDVIPAGTYVLGILNFSATNPPVFTITMDAQ
jgi:hypothetical protein